MRKNPMYNKGYDDGFADGANQFDTLFAEAIANYMVVKGTGSTLSGNRIFDFDEICEHFHISKERLEELQDEIVSLLESKPQLCDTDGVWVDDDSFNLMFFLNYCDMKVDE